MSPELKELFEIKRDDKKNNKPADGQNIALHAAARLSVIVLGTAAFSIAMNEAKGWGALGFAFYMVIFHAVWLLFIIIETVILQHSRKLRLRNVNLIFIGVILFIYIIGALIIFGDI